MFRIPPRPFLSDDRGAIAVEWVVLAAGVTTMGIAAMTAERDALAAFWNRINGEVSATSQRFDFSDGAAGWTGASVTDIPGFGDALGPIGGSQGLEIVTRTFTFPTGRETAKIALDLYALDSLDGEDAVFYVNGTEVGRVSALSGMTTSTSAEVDGVAFTGTMIDGDAQLGGYMHGDQDYEKDSITRVEITLDRPGETVTVGMGSTASHGAADESFALDNMAVTGVEAGT